MMCTCSASLDFTMFFKKQIKPHEKFIFNSFILKISNCKTINIRNESENMIFLMEISFKKHLYCQPKFQFILLSNFPTLLKKLPE